MGWFRKTTTATVCAERLYKAVVETELGDMTPEKLRISNSKHEQYQRKALFYRENCLLAATAAVMGNTPMREVMFALERLVREKRKKRGALGYADDEDIVYPAIDNFEDLFTDLFKWSQRWLMEFRHDPNDNFMVALFADHWMRQFSGMKNACELTKNALGQ